MSVAEPLKFLLPAAKVRSTVLSAVRIFTKPKFPSPTIRLPAESYTISFGLSIPLPELSFLFMLAELSKSINMLAGTSPGPEPGGKGLEIAF